MAVASSCLEIQSLGTLKTFPRDPMNCHAKKKGSSLIDQTENSGEVGGLSLLLKRLSEKPAHLSSCTGRSTMRDNTDGSNASHARVLCTAHVKPGRAGQGAKASSINQAGERCHRGLLGRHVTLHLQITFGDRKLKGEPHFYAGSAFFQLSFAPRKELMRGCYGESLTTSVNGRKSAHSLQTQTEELTPKHYFPSTYCVPSTTRGPRVCVMICVHLIHLDGSSLC